MVVSVSLSINHYIPAQINPNQASFIKASNKNQQHPISEIDKNQDKATDN